MTTTSETAATSTSANRGVKRGLPDSGLKEAEKAVKSLWDIARLGLTSQQAFAEKLGRKSASGGSWAALMALIRGFGLVRQDGEQIGLSENGQALVNDSDPVKQAAARRAAIFKLKAYRELVTSFDGTTLPDASTVASRLKYDYGKTDDFALRAAKAFIESLRHAEMIDETGHVRSGGVDKSSHVPPLEKPDDADQADEIEAEEERQSAEIDEAFAEHEDGNDDGASGSRRTEFSLDRLGGGQLAVTVNVTLDLSKYRADEVIQILRALSG